MNEGYPFILERKDFRGADDLLKYSLIYKFKTTKSGHEYIAKAERYVDNAYCIKFFDYFYLHL